MKKRWLYRSLGAVIGLVLGWLAASSMHPAKAVNDPPAAEKP
jgi:hypothetical protein